MAHQALLAGGALDPVEDAANPAARRLPEKPRRRRAIAAAGWLARRSPEILEPSHHGPGGQEAIAAEDVPALVAGGAPVGPPGERLGAHPGAAHLEPGLGAGARAVAAVGRARDPEARARERPQRDAPHGEQ